MPAGQADPQVHPVGSVFLDAIRALARWIGVSVTDRQQATASHSLAELVLAAGGGAGGVPSPVTADSDRAERS